MIYPIEIAARIAAVQSKQGMSTSGSTYVTVSLNTGQSSYVQCAEYMHYNKIKQSVCILLANEIVFSFAGKHNETCNDENEENICDCLEDDHDHLIFFCFFACIFLFLKGTIEKTIYVVIFIIIYFLLSNYIKKGNQCYVKIYEFKTK